MDGGVEFNATAIGVAHVHVRPARRYAPLCQRLPRAIAACPLPLRARRTDPRVVKGKISSFVIKHGSPDPFSQSPLTTTIQILPCDLRASHDLDRPSAAHTVQLLPSLV